MKKAIVLGADNGYMDKVETTIKSVCAHNHNIKFYIFNDDLPSDWFRIMNFRLKANHSEIVNVKISDHTLKNYRLAISYLSYAAYFRYFIGEFVEEDRAIYLDSDIIVTSCLDELFNIDLEDYWLAGVADYFDGDYTGGFNSGMMVIPVKKWKESDIANQLLQLTEQYHQTVFGDQGILNILFKEKWKKVGRLYNFMVGMDTLAQVVNDESWYQSSLPDGVLPKVIHYTGDKPWYHLSKNRYRSIWWFYYSVEWSDILLRKNPIKGQLLSDFNTLIDPPLFHTAIFTDSCELEQIETEFYGQYFLLFSEDEQHAVLFTQADYKLIAGPLPFLHRFFPDLSAQKQEFLEFKNEELSYRHTVGYEQAMETAVRFMNWLD